MSLDRPLHVVHLLGSLDRGGAELRLVEAAEQLSRLPEAPRQTFLLLSGREGDLAARARAAGTSIVTMPLDLSFPIRYWQWLRSNRPDVAHSHVHASSGWLLAPARLCGIKVRIAHFRSTGDGHAPSLRRRLQHAVGMKLIGWTATSIVAGTESVLDAVFPKGWRHDGRMSIVPQGVPVAKFLAALGRAERQGSTSIRFLQMGRIDPDKNQLFGVEAFASIAASLPDATLMLVGRQTEPYSSAVRTKVAELGLVDRVAFLGPTDSVAEIMASADVLVHPTLREGWPGVLVEGFISGMQVISSTIPPVQEVASQLPGVRLVDLSTGANAFGLAMVESASSVRDAFARWRHCSDLIDGELDISRAARRLTALWGQT